MRYFIRVSVVICTLFALATEPAGAASINIGEFASDRVFREFGGVDYENIWSRLSDPTNFGPAGIVPNSVALAAPLPIATSESLAELDIFIMSEVFTPLAASEAIAIAEFVANGGCLVIVADTLHASDPPGGNGTIPGNLVLGLLDGTTIGPFDLTGDQTATAGTITGLVSAVTDGPFGSFDIGDTFGASWNTPLTMGGEAQAIGARNGSTILGLIEGDALGDGAGAVLIAGDLLFSDSFIPPGINGGATESEANATLFLNFIADCDSRIHSDVPEPSTFAMLVVAATTLLPLSGRRGRARR